MSNKSLHKSEIVYERLYKEYGEWDSVTDFMKEFGQSRQSFYDRKRAEKIPYDEIKQVFPEVNKEWLISDDINELKSMPVRVSHTNPDKYEESFNEYEDRINEEGKPYNAADLLLEALEGEAARIRDDLDGLVSRIRKVRQLKKSDE